MTSVVVTPRFGINPFSLGAFVIAALVWSGVFHLSEAHAFAASVPGTALGAVGARWAVRKGERQWFPWTALGLNVVVTLIGFIVLLAYLASLIPGTG